MRVGGEGAVHRRSAPAIARAMDVSILCVKRLPFGSPGKKAAGERYRAGTCGIPRQACSDIVRRMGGEERSLGPTRHVSRRHRHAQSLIPVARAFSRRPAFTSSVTSPSTRPGHRQKPGLVPGKPPAANGSLGGPYNCHAASPMGPAKTQRLRGGRNVGARPIVASGAGGNPQTGWATISRRLAKQHPAGHPDPARPRSGCGARSLAWYIDITAFPF